jgi:alpha-ketoglutarate-dependent taurine dioxygenase
LSSVQELLTRLASQEIKLWIDGDKLRCSGPESLMTAALKSELAQRKIELLEALTFANRTNPAVPQGDDPVPDSRNAVDLFATPSMDPAIIDYEIDAQVAWRGSDLPADAGVVSLSRECAAEIAALVRLLRANPFPLVALRPDDFDLPACRALMLQVKQKLETPLRFAVVDRLDMTSMSHDEARSVYWLLASMVARPVAQKWAGAMTYDVCDLGKKSLRAVDTNDELNYHTDNAFNTRAPDYVALLCLQKAKDGGMSKLVNFSAVHNEIRRRAPALLARLYGTYIFSRQGEHAANDAPTIRHALFENHQGEILGRLSRFHVRTGQALAGEALDSDGAAALEMLEAIMNEPSLGFEYWFEPGQIQIIDNRRIGHKRTSFIDWPEPERRRRLMRLWLRNSGRPFYNG